MSLCKEPYVRGTYHARCSCVSVSHQDRADRIRFIMAIVHVLLQILLQVALSYDREYFRLMGGNSFTVHTAEVFACTIVRVWSQKQLRKLLLVSHMLYVHHRDVVMTRFFGHAALHSLYRYGLDAQVDWALVAWVGVSSYSVAVLTLEIREGAIESLLEETQRVR